MFLLYILYMGAVVVCCGAVALLVGFVAYAIVKGGSDAIS